MSRRFAPPPLRAALRVTPALAAAGEAVMREGALPADETAVAVGCRKVERRHAASLAAARTSARARLRGTALWLGRQYALSAWRTGEKVGFARSGWRIYSVRRPGLVGLEVRQMASAVVGGVAGPGFRRGLARFAAHEGPGGFDAREN